MAQLVVDVTNNPFEICDGKKAQNQVFVLYFSFLVWTSNVIQSKDY